MFDQDANLSPGNLGPPMLAAMSGYNGLVPPQPGSPSAMAGMPGSFQWWAMQQQMATMSSQHSPNGYFTAGPYGGMPMAQPPPLGSPSAGGYGQPGFNYNSYSSRVGNNNNVQMRPVTQQRRRGIFGAGRFPQVSQTQNGGIDKLIDSFGELQVQANGVNGTNGHENKSKTPFFTNAEPSFSNLVNGGDSVSKDVYSRKVFVGGLPPDIDEDEICNTFSRFGSLSVDWPHKAESKSYFPPKGYCFLIFEMECSVQMLMSACVPEGDKYYVPVSSPTMKDKPVQIRPWRLLDADYVADESLGLDPRKTVFVGGVPRPLKAVELANIMDRFYGGVCYCGIDTDPDLRYPKGAGRVAFSNQQSYIAAISARFVQLQQGDIDKRVEVKPYVLDDQTCDECGGSRCGHKFAPFFCANVTCLQYYCETCWALIHSQPGREYHKPLVKEGADRPRSVPFRWM